MMHNAVNLHNVDQIFRPFALHLKKNCFPGNNVPYFSVNDFAKKKLILLDSMRHKNLVLKIIMAERGTISHFINENGRILQVEKKMERHSKESQTHYNCESTLNCGFLQRKCT